MGWQISKEQDEREWFREYVTSVIASVASPLPQASRKIGSVQVNWFESEPGIAVILSKGGSIDERHLAEWIVRAELEACGYKRAQFTFDHIALDGEEKIAMVRESSWDDIMAKSKRLIQSGNVQILRNGYNSVVAHVIGDHGEYNVEIGRDDPNSRAITQWTCDCLIPGSRIILADGSLKRVEDIKSGDLVLTATGRSGRVGRTFKRGYHGQIVGLKIVGSTEEVWVTANHKLANAKLDVIDAKAWKDGDYTFLPNLEVDEISEIRVQDFVGGLEDHEGVLVKRNVRAGVTRAAVERPRIPLLEELPSEFNRPEMFWAKVNKGDSCWIWEGSCKRANGRYPVAIMGGRQMLARKVAWMLSGRTLQKGTQLLQTCKENRCVNPDHSGLRVAKYERIRIPEFSDSRNRFPATISWDEQFARLAGWYVAEGLTTPRGEVKWTLGFHEEGFAAEILSWLKLVLGLEGWEEVQKEKSTRIVCVANTTLARLFERLFGTGAHDKKLHPYVMAMPIGALSSFK